ncbi:MAG: hypothetical protein AAGD38_07150 [Acidobacteriota bacterium]
MRTPSKMVVDRQRSTLDVANFAAENVDKVASELESVLGRYVIDTETVPDFGLVQTLMARFLETRLEQLVLRDEEQIDQQTAEMVPRRQRDEAAARVRDRLLVLRQAAVAHFGDLSPEIVPIANSTATVPEALWRQAKHTLVRFNDPDRPLPPPIVEGLPTDLTPWLRDLEGANDELRDALDNLSAARARTASAYDLKTGSMSALDREVRSIVRVLEGLYGLAGRPELAESVRRPLRRPIKSSNEEPAAAPPENEVPEPEPIALNGVTSDPVN